MKCFNGTLIIIDNSIRLVSKSHRVPACSNVYTCYGFLSLQFTVLMGVVSSVFLSHQKCLRLYKQSQAYCVYPVDLVFCVLIVLLLLPQIIVVRCVFVCIPMWVVLVVCSHTPTHTHTHTHIHTSQAYWYRRGELEPKFRRLIYYNAIVTILLCVCGNLYFFQLGFEPYPQPTVSPSTQSPITSKLNYWFPFFFIEPFKITSGLIHY